MDNELQARERCLEDKINRGTEAARAAFEIANVMRKCARKVAMGNGERRGRLRCNIISGATYSAVMPGKNRRVLGISSGQSADSGICPTAYRRDGRASAGNR